jgi:hypothetical protein
LVDEATRWPPLEQVSICGDLEPVASSADRPADRRVGRSVDGRISRGID